MCKNPPLIASNDEIIRHLAYDTAISSWVLNIGEHKEEMIYDIIDGTTLVKLCDVGVRPTQLAQTVLRTCTTGIVETCPLDWTDEFFRAQCEAGFGGNCSTKNVMFRNIHCVDCNSIGSDENLMCETTISGGGELPNFMTLLIWQSQEKRTRCQQDTPVYDPFKQICRSIHIEGKS
jgi:hypothetical protein